LNHAGKKNGAISDLDKFLHLRSERLAGVDTQPKNLQQFIIEEHARRWSKRMLAEPLKYDLMHFGSDGLMRDWRMSNAHWTHFALELDQKIGGLAATEGAYFVPGGYKTQVYTQYHLKGKTTIIEPRADPGADPDHLGDIEGLPDGVFVL